MATALRQVYKCGICGDIVEVLHSGAGEPVCCEQPMELLDEKRKGEGEDKHVPVIKKEGGKIKVKVGKNPHPMEENHYIEWVELIADGHTLRTNLLPGSDPEAEFDIKAAKVEARIYCNVHGLWTS